MWMYLAALTVQGLVMASFSPYRWVAVAHGFFAGVLAMSAGVNYKRERDARRQPAAGAHDVPVA